MIEVKNLKKRFGSTWITNGVNLAVPQGTMTIIIGRSGEGKSLLLKQIMGLIPPTEGTIYIDGTSITNASKQIIQQQYKKMGYVFQFAALLDSLTVFENIGISLLESDMKKSDVLPIVKEKLALVDLPPQTLHKYPCELSGGMKKRVGFARTLVTNPKIILYDEPTTGLDPITSRLIHELMYTMQRTLGISSIVVSHDVEIFNYADQVALLYQGKIQHVCQAQSIWQSQNPFIYQFIRGLTQGPMS